MFADLRMSPVQLYNNKKEELKMKFFAPRMAALTVIIAIAMLTAASATCAAEFPDRPIHLVVPFPAGGIVDWTARLLGEKLSIRYSQPVLIDNRPGAGGVMATAQVAKAEPDGYTLLIVSPAFVIAPRLQKGVAWNPLRDFRALARVAIDPIVFVVHPSLPVTNIREFINLAKTSNLPVMYGSAGIGTSPHLAFELLGQMAGLNFTHVPYKGQPEQLKELLSGQVKVGPITLTQALPQIKSGKLRPLAIASARRSEMLPEVPTVAEAAGLHGYEVTTWIGLLASANVPEALVRKIALDFEEILKMPDVRTKFDFIGLELSPQSAADFDLFVAHEDAKWASFMKSSGIQETGGR